MCTCKGRAFGRLAKTWKVSSFFQDGISNAKTYFLAKRWSFKFHYPHDLWVLKFMDVICGEYSAGSVVKAL